VGLAEEAKKKTGVYSRGMRQRLGLADVLIKNPEVIILDEPTLGIDPKGVREFLNLIVHLSSEQGITVLLSSHHLHQVQQVCDRVGLFVGGRLIAEGAIAALSAKLFEGEPFLVEAGITYPGRDTAPVIREQDILPLCETLQQVEGVRSVTFTEGSLHIGCSTDATVAVSRSIIQSGYGLTYLQKKVYGLDDIYNRYFEGSSSYGKTA
jgi:ABC-2 type transport system ATP-binding protein